MIANVSRKKIQKVEEQPTAKRQDPTQPEAWTDIANARLFAEQFQGKVAYIAERNKFFAFDGSRWSTDGDVQAQEYAKVTANGIWESFRKNVQRVNTDTQNEMLKWARQSSSRSGISNMLALAKSDERILKSVDVFNTKLNLFNMANGTLDLATGKLHSHSPGDYLTQITKNVAYNPEATCPKWLETLTLIFDDIDVTRYVQTLLGLALAGTREEAVLPICIGDGNNGKSTLWNTILWVFDEYGTLGSQELLVPAKHAQHPADKAALFGRRFVAISELAQGRSFAEERVKELTGDTYVTCRGMRENFWTYHATHQFWMSANHLPQVRGTDEGIWRRLKPIPFRYNISERAKALGLKERKNFTEWLVANEGPGIFNWLLEGYQTYRRIGLVEPAAVSQAAYQYRRHEDDLASFIEQHCELGDKLKIGAAELFKSYQMSGGTKSNRVFGDEMTKRFTKKSTKKGNVYLGIAARGEGCEGSSV